MASEDQKVPCQYCGDLFDKRGIKLHEEKCAQNPANVEKAEKEGKVEPAGESLDEMAILGRILTEAGIRDRKPAIVRAFSYGNTRNVKFLDELLRMAGATVPARRLAVRNWAAQMGIDIPEPLKSELETAVEEKKPELSEPEVKSFRDLRKTTRASLLEDMQEEYEYERLRDQLGEVRRKTDDGRRDNTIEIPLRDPKSGEFVTDSKGQPVFVKTTPERLMMMQAFGGPQKPAQDPTTTMLLEMVKHQNEMELKRLELGGKGEGEEMKVYREELKTMREMLAKSEQDKRDIQIAQMEQRLQEAERRVAAQPDDMERFFAYQDRLKERGLLGGDNREIEMIKTSRDTMNNAFRVMLQQQSSMNANAQKLVDSVSGILPQVMEDNRRARIAERTQRPAVSERPFTPRQLETLEQAIPEAPPGFEADTPETAAAAGEFHVIGGKGHMTPVTEQPET